MASGNKLVLSDGYQNITTDGDTFGDAKALPPHSNDTLLTCIVRNHVGGTFRVHLEHSPDGINWIQASGGSTGTLSADGAISAYVSIPTFSNVRCKITTASSASGDCEASIYFSNKK